MKTEYIIPMIALGILTACGGGGGGGGDASDGSTGNTSDSAPSEPSPPVQPVVRTMEDLSIPDTMDYKPSEGYSLTVDASNEVSGRAFVSVYTDYQSASSGEWLPDYDSRIASTGLSNGSARIEFTAAEHVNAFLVEIWTYDGQPPRQKIVSAEDSLLIW